MQYTQTDGIYIIAINKGELVHATIHEFCNRHEIPSAVFHGIGAMEFVRCGWYDLPATEYRFTEYEQLVEVVSYHGNVAHKTDGPFVHAHGVFSDSDNQTFGGHVDEMRVGVAFELVLTPLSQTIARTYDDTIGLHLLDLPNN